MFYIDRTDWKVSNTHATDDDIIINAIWIWWIDLVTEEQTFESHSFLSFKTQVIRKESMGLLVHPDHIAIFSGLDSKDQGLHLCKLCLSSLNNAFTVDFS